MKPEWEEDGRGEKHDTHCNESAVDQALCPIIVSYQGFFCMSFVSCGCAILSASVTQPPPMVL
jgi:hypothetical protein